MKAKKIMDSDISALKVASLPTRPTAPKEYGGMGYKATEMKEAFDKLPEYIIARFNDLIDDIESESSDSVIHSIKLGLGNGMTLADLIYIIQNGAVLGMISLGDTSLREYILKLRTDLDACMTALGIGG